MHAAPDRGISPEAVISLQKRPESYLKRDVSTASLFFS